MRRVNGHPNVLDLVALFETPTSYDFVVSSRPKALSLSAFRCVSAE